MSTSLGGVAPPPAVCSAIADPNCPLVPVNSNADVPPHR